MNSTTTVDTSSNTDESVVQLYEEGVEMYSMGRYFSADLLFKEAAAAKHSQSMYMLGIMCSKGQCGCYNKQEALEWFRKAAELGNKRAEYILQDEDDPNIDEKLREEVKSQQVLEKAKTGDAAAQWEMGHRYSLGCGVLKDATEAFKWYNKAAEQEYDLALFDLGCCYKDGVGVPKNYGEAIKYFRKSAEKNYGPAQYELGLYFKNMASCSHTDAAIHALYWFSLAAEDGVVEARMEMARAYYYGEVLKQDYSKARRWLQKLLGWEIPEYLYMLGVLYKEGRGSIIKDEKYAIILFEKAAEEDHIESIKALASCYEDGLGVEVDYGKSLDYYSRAADMGDDEAKEKAMVIQQKHCNAITVTAPKQKQQPAAQIAAQLAAQITTLTRIATIRNGKSVWRKIRIFLRNLISVHSK